MKKKMLNVLILASGCLTLPVSAAPFDGAQPLICASTEILECIPGDGCSRVTAESIDAPQFIRIDFAANALSAERVGGGTKVSQIERSETVDGKLMLQGAEDGVEGVRDGLGWTLAIGQETGKMSLTASGDEVGFVIFGACTAI
jgi:hypothetical protein